MILGEAVIAKAGGSGVVNCPKIHPQAYDNSKDEAWGSSEGEHPVLKEELTELSQENLDSAIRLARISMESAEKLVKLQLEASRTFVEDNVRNVKALAQAKMPEDLAALRRKFAESSFTKAMEYSRSLYEIAAETQAEFKHLMERRIAEYGRDDTPNASPFHAGVDLVTSALKATMAASTAAMDTLTQAAKQMSNFAEASFSAAMNRTNAGQEARPASERREREPRSG
jgi:phasin family protein